MSERTRQFDRRVVMSRREKREHQAAEPRAEPTAERIRPAGGDFERGHSGQITMRDSPLERAFARKLITHQQYSVGQKYRHHWYHAGLAGRLESIDLNRIFATDPANFSGLAKTEAQVFHRQRYREATQAVGKIGSHVLDCIVCRETPLDHKSAIRWAGAAVRRRMPRQSSG
jgi:hypothetical protein